MAIQKYGTLSLEQLDEDAARVAALSHDAFYKFEVGETVLRFLPNRTPGLSPFRITATHYLDNVPGSQTPKTVFACPKQELGIPCPVCARAIELGRQSSPQERKLAKNFEPTLTIYANALIRSTGTLAVLKFGKQIFDGLKAIRRSAASGGNYTDPSAAGFDISITRVGTGQNDTRYSVAAARHNSPAFATDAELDAFMETLKDLDSLVQAEIPDFVLAYVQPRIAFAPPTGASATTQRSMVGASFARPAFIPATAAPTTPVVPSASAADDIEYDDDFNPIVR